MRIDPIERNQDDDARLAVLWIDDRFHRIAPAPDKNLWQDWEPWFVVTLVDSPLEIEKLLLQEEGEAAGGRELRSPQRSPFDIYLTDFRLCEEKEDCGEPEHLGAGIHAPAAGFMCGMFTALRTPRDVQCIVPYSGYDEEYGPLWNLAARFCPTTLTVAWEDAVTKGNINQDELRKLGSRTFRRAIENACRRGTSHIPFAVRTTLENVIAGSGPVIPATAKLAFSSGGAIRDVFIGSLFNDCLSAGRNGGAVPKSAVADWLGRIPTVDPIELRARELASLYWRVRRTPYSRLRYAVLHQWREKGVDAIDGNDRSTLSLGWLGEMVHDVTSDDERNQVLRLATLFLIISEEAHKFAVRQKGGLSERAAAALEYMRRYLAEPVQIEDAFVRLVGGDSEKCERLIEDFRQIQAVVAAEDGSVDGETPEIVRAYSPFGEIDLCHLVDPLPARVSAVGWGKEKKIGRALLRADLDIIKLVRDGDPGDITPTERAAVVRYALEICLPKDSYPKWLQ